MTEHYFTLYALKGETVDSATSVLEDELTLKMDKVDSGAWGYYTAFEPTEENEKLYVYQNLQYDDGPYLREKRYPQHEVLISVYKTNRSELIKKVILSNFDASIIRESQFSPPQPKPFYE